MKDNILKVDLDYKLRWNAIKVIRERLDYIHKIGLFRRENIKSVTLVKKTKYSVKIYLEKDISEDLIVILQLILGSDYQKEANSVYNRKVLGMKYWNRLFDVKRYKSGKIKSARKEDITKKVF